MTTTEVLQSALEAGLLDIGDEEGRFAHLEGAADDLRAVLIKAPAGVIAYTLVALDPDVALDEPVIVEIDQILAKRWKTLRGRYADPPRQLLRAVAAAGVNAAATADPGIQDAAWLTAASFLPHARLGRDDAWIRPLVNAWGAASEKRLAVRWMVEPQADAEFTLRIQSPSLTTSKWNGGTDAEELQTDFARAAGPHNAQGAATGSNPNPYHANQTSTWVEPFASRASEGVAKQIDSVAASLAKYTADAVTAVQGALATQAESLSGALKALPNHVRVPTGLALRSTLLWWRESLYSPALLAGYREVDTATAVIAMAAEAHAAASGPAPASVAYLLKEAVRDVAEQGDGGGGRSVNEWFAEMSQSHHRETLATLLDADSALPGGRTSLLALLRAAARGQDPNGMDVLRLLGVPGDTNLAAPNLAIWIFRAMQAEAALPSARRRRR